MIKCAWMLTDLAGGGAERIPLVLAPALRQTELTVMLLKDRVEHGLPNEAPAIIVLSTGDQPLAVAGPSILMRSARLARNFDLLVAGLEWAPTFFARASGVLARRPVIATVHANLERYDELERVPRSWWSAMGVALRSCAAVVAVSKDVQTSVLSLGVAEDRVHVIPNPVAFPATITTSQRSRRTILTVASLKLLKGVDVALAAAAQLRDLHFEWTIVGEGPERKRLEELARELGVSDRVRFAGFQRDPRPFYAAADLFVLPSRAEGFSLALVEAMGAGLPVVATRCAAIIEAHVSGGAGELVPVDDANAIATAVRSLLANPARSIEMGRIGRVRAQAYAPSAIAGLYDELFALVLDSHPTSRHRRRRIQ